MGFSDLGRRMVTSKRETFAVTSRRAVFTLSERIVEGVASVSVDGVELEPSQWAWVWGENSVSIGVDLEPSARVEIVYERSPVHDILVANWSPAYGNLVFRSTVKP